TGGRRGAERIRGRRVRRRGIDARDEVGEHVTWGSFSNADRSRTGARTCPSAIAGHRLPDWVKFAPAAGGGGRPVVRVARVPADGGYSVRSFGADGRLLSVTLPIPATPAAAGWF